MSVRYSAIAQRELAASITYLSKRNPTAAFALARSVIAIVSSLDAREFEGREVILGRRLRARRWPVESLVIYYRRKGDVLEVLRVYDGRRASIERV